MKKLIFFISCVSSNDGLYFPRTLTTIFSTTIVPIIDMMIENAIIINKFEVRLTWKLESINLALEVVNDIKFTSIEPTNNVVPYPKATPPWFFQGGV